MKSYKITDLQLEQYLLNELPADIMNRISSELKTDPGLKIRLEELKNSGRDIIAKYPADIMAAKILAGINKIKPEISRASSADIKNEPAASILTYFLNGLHNLINGRSRKIAYSIAAVSAMTAAFVIIFNIPGIISNRPVIKDDDIIRIKGMEPGISVHRKNGSRIEELKNMSKASRGDLLQIGYISTGEYRHGIIFSIDGRGAVTLHFPESENGETSLKLNRKVMLQRAYELDDSPDFEKFIFIISQEPINTKRIIEKAKILAQSKDKVLNGKLEAGNNTVEFSLTIKK